ncbi:MAG: hypothetical protein GY943_08280 [Chloroflexi bacterium]|nr:hypothetical protein [Chloroflexota bacterium]
MSQPNLRIAGLLLLLILVMGCSMVTAVTPPITPTPLSTAIAITTPTEVKPTDTAVTLPTIAVTEILPTPSPVIAVIGDGGTGGVGGDIVETAVSTIMPTPTFAAYGITQTIGFSTQNRPIVRYRFGIGTRHVVLVGGIHGGYEWNTIVLAYALIDYFTESPERIPSNVTLTIIPSANPDGQHLATGVDGRFLPDSVQRSMEDARFNSNLVDLNRNWDCDWQPVGVWGEREVNAGNVPFSELETQVLRRFFLGQNVDAVLFFHSKADGVFSGGCGNVYQPALALATIYGDASGYPIFEQFTHYQVTGDASDWLALQGIPSFSVELKTHSDIDWDENLAGVLAMLDFYALR